MDYFTMFVNPQKNPSFPFDSPFFNIKNYSSFVVIDISEIMLQEIFPTPLFLGEGPVWDERVQRLYFVDILSKRMYRYSFDTKRAEEYQFEEFISCIALHNDPDIVLIALESGIYALNTSTRETTFVVQPEKKPNYRFNDGSVDREGNWVIGSMNNINNGAEATHQPDASLYRVNGSEANVLLENVTISNGIAFSDREMYYIDSIHGNVRRFDYSNGELRDEKVVFEVEKDVSPDGMTLSKSNKLYVALWGGAKIIVYDLNKSALVSEIPLPVPNPTSCTFGGKDMNTLFITTASLGERTDAGVYAINLEDEGHTENKVHWPVLG